mgnify:CR=1 FL=1
MKTESIDTIQNKPTFAYMKRFKKSGLEKGITTANQCKEGKEELAGYKQLMAETKKTYDEMLAPLNKRRAVILEWKREDLAAIAEIDRKLTKLVQVYDDEANQKREAEAVKALAQAEQDAEDSRDSEIEELNVIADIAKAEGRIDDQLALEQQAEVIKASPPPIPIIQTPKPMAPSTPLIATIKYSAVLTTDESTAKKLLVKAVAQNKVPPAIFKLNLTWVNSYARSLKEDFNLPGFKLVIAKSYKRKGGLGQ